MQVFKEGMIVKIYCENFLTYDKVTCFPCSKLNMIVGPNGTGKSSLVNAIVLGLGGKLSVIGRSKQLSAYVKRGLETAKIEIEIYSEPRNYVIGRKFNIENKNHWTINNQPASLKQVEHVIKTLNIQIDNLCQFLPQDRVQDFAKMDSKQLLENTLKTVGGNELVDLHDDLKLLRSKELNLDVQMQSFKQQLGSEKMKASRLETEVSAIKEREEMLKSIEEIKKKKAWLEFQEAENHKKEILKDREKVLKGKTAAEKTLKPFECDVRATKETINIIDKNISQEIRVCVDNITALRQKFETVASADDRVHNVVSELKRKLESEKSREAKCETLQQEIQCLEATVDPSKEFAICLKRDELQSVMLIKTKDISNASAEIKKYEDQLAEVTRNKNRLEGALEREQSAASIKKQILSQKFGDAYRAYEWLNKNRSQFRHHIYGPVMLELNCKDEGAKYVEFLVYRRDLCAFLCEDCDDMNKLLRIVRDQLGCKINVVQATRNFNQPVCDNFSPPCPLDQIRQFGFWSYCIDQVEGPNAVLNYLCKNYGLHQVPIGNQLTNSKTDVIPQQIKSYFSDSEFFNVRTSKYSGERLSRMVSVGPSVLLAGSTRSSVVHEYQASLNCEMDKLNSLKRSLDSVTSQVGLLEREREELRGRKKLLDQQLLSLKTGSANLKMKKEELELFKVPRLDPDEENLKVKHKIKGYLVQACSLQTECVSRLKNYQGSLAKGDINKLKLTVMQNILKQKEQALFNNGKKVEEYKKMLVNVEEELKKAQRDFKQIQEKALSLTDNLSPKDVAFKQKYNRVFASLPEDVEGLEAEISRLAARADCLVGGRISVLEEYEKTIKSIEKLEKAISNPQEQMEDLRNEMNEKKGRWIPQVLSLVTRINSNFTNFFSHMKCVGEVSLEEPDDKNEYSKYGICIKVQFRASGSLQQLGPYTQSGGERAVATAIYMLSLQELTTVPFRCVDEINQGMDELNERVVFNLMVHTVEKTDSAQCFLLTPKILHHLDYGRNVQTLCIYSKVSPPTAIQICRKYFEQLNNKRVQLNQKKSRGSLKRRLSETDD